MPRGTPSVSEAMGQKDFREMVITNSCCRGKRHPLSTNVQRVRLSRIGERNRAFSRRVDDSEEINTESNTSDLYLRRAGNPKTESSEEQAKRHKRKSSQKQISPAESVDSVNCWDGEKEVDNTEAHGGTKSAKL